MNRWWAAFYILASFAAIAGSAVYLAYFLTGNDGTLHWLGLSVGMFSIAALIAAHERTRKDE